MSSIASKPADVEDEFFAKTPLAVLAMPVVDLSNGAKVVYAGLHTFTDHKTNGMVCWPGVPKLASRVGLGTTQVNEYIKELESAGLIRVKRRTGKSNHYTLAPPGSR